MKDHPDSAIAENMLSKIYSERLNIVLTHSNEDWKKDKINIDLVDNMLSLQLEKRYCKIIFVDGNCKHSKRTGLFIDSSQRIKVF